MPSPVRWNWRDRRRAVIGTLQPQFAGVHVRVPASSANLGPGFDAFGMALALYDEVEIRLAGSGTEVTVTGEGAGTLPSGQRHLVVRALLGAAETLGLDLPGLRLHCTNVIPHSRGLGSSAAAIVAGIAGAYGLAGMPLDAAALRLAAEREGHADNVAASLFGALALAWQGPDGFAAVRLEPAAGLRILVLVPEMTSATRVTRDLLPAVVPHRDAAFTAGRGALLLHALTSDPSLLLAATEDRLHQEYRRSAWPASMALVDVLRGTGVPAAISGAGPTVLAFAGNAELPGGVDITGFHPRELAIDHGGVTVRTLPDAPG
ncbi:MAG: homoserine kinase [Sciscionella sp.]